MGLASYLLRHPKQTVLGKYTTTDLNGEVATSGGGGGEGMVTVPQGAEARKREDQNY